MLANRRLSIWRLSIFSVPAYHRCDIIPTEQLLGDGHSRVSIDLVPSFEYSQRAMDTRAWKSRRSEGPQTTIGTKDELPLGAFRGRRARRRSKGYWKTNDGTNLGFQRYNQTGNPIWGKLTIGVKVVTRPLRTDAADN